MLRNSALSPQYSLSIRVAVVEISASSKSLCFGSRNTPTLCVDACKRLKRAGREAKSGQDPEKIQLKPSEEEEPSVFTDPNGVPSGGGPDF